MPPPDFVGGGFAALRGMMADHEGVPLLRMRGVRKSFGGTVALAGVDLEVRAGEVHALIGENGAGKSTLMKILSGALRADGGSVELDGRRYAPDDPGAAFDRGIAMIYQELSLAPHLSVEDNILLGREGRIFGAQRRRARRPVVERALAVLDHPEITPRTLVRELAPGARQLVEIARALRSGARLLVMDEPTSSLSGKDTARLFEVIARLRSQGVAIIYISHFLEEVRQVAQRFTVLRDGAAAGTGDVPGTSTARLIELMIGRRPTEMFPPRDRSPGAVVLRIDHLAGERRPQDASLELRRGEILGLAGLVGAGRTELLRAVFGLDRVGAGTITVGAFTDHGRGVRFRLGQGVGLLSEDRKGEGLALGLSIALNLTLSRPGPFTTAGIVAAATRRECAAQWMEKLGIRARDPDQPVGDLSGGNQQKVALARLLHHRAEVLLLDDPTRGIDVGSRAEIYRTLAGLARDGAAILFVSSYLPELLGLCDRIAVMRRGVLGPARAASELTEHALLTEATTG